MNENPRKLDLQTLKIIWFALFIVPFTYIGVLILIFQNDPQEGGTAQHLILPVTLVALVNFALAWFLPRFVITKKDTPHAQETLDQLCQRVGSGIVVRWALFEGTTLFGWILSFINRDITYVIPFFVLTLAGLGLNYPSEDKMKKLGK